MTTADKGQLAERQDNVGSLLAERKRIHLRQTRIEIAIGMGIVILLLILHLFCN